MTEESPIDKYFVQPKTEEPVWTHVSGFLTRILEKESLSHIPGPKVGIRACLYGIYQTLESAQTSGYFLRETSESQEVRHWGIEAISYFLGRPTARGLDSLERGNAKMIQRCLREGEEISGLRLIIASQTLGRIVRPYWNPTRIVQVEGEFHEIEGCFSCKWFAGEYGCCYDAAKKQSESSKLKLGSHPILILRSTPRRYAGKCRNWKEAEPHNA